MTKIKTGISGLDEMLHGGILLGKNILVSGPCGSGKTTIAMQFVLNGIKNTNEPGLYLTLEQSKEKVKEDMASFGFELEKFEKSGKLVVLGGKIASIQEMMDKAGADVSHLFEEIEDVIKEKKIKRVAIDSLNLLVLFHENGAERRRTIARLGELLSNLGCTSILTSEIPEKSNQLSTYGVEEFIADGVILLSRIKEEDRLVNVLSVRKMRGTNHEKDIRTYEITNTGVKIYHNKGSLIS